MGKALVIAEKPSVANDLARSLGKFEKHKEFFENEEYLISSAVGHLLELCLPNELDKKRGKWKMENLPIIPDQFELKPIEKSEPRLRVLEKLLQRKDVDRLINACDAGREGELIFRYIVQYTKSKKPIQRLWLQSMTPTSIREAFHKLRTDDEMKPLAAAAVCRSESDWLIGINATRAFTAFNSQEGGFQLTPAGRVQTPTLAILVDREDKIKRFKPSDFWEIHAVFAVAVGTYPGRWFDENFKKDKEGGEWRAEQIREKAKAEAIYQKCLGKVGIVTEEKKPSQQLPPLLYDLTSLQREGNSRFGLSAKRTLQIAQSLYEKHKMLTYPRTDSRHLPQNYGDLVEQTLGNLDVTSEVTLSKDVYLGQLAKKILRNKWVNVSNRRIFNDTKISDHHAIIPTAYPAKHLDEFEQKIYDMVARRFLAVFYPAAEFELTHRITRVEGEAFKTEGKILKVPGWLEVYGKQEQGSEDNLPVVQEGEKAKTQELEVRDLQTKPPPRYTEATLLSAMEGAGKLVDDEDLRAAMAEKGLGTPATRASIIEHLIAERYVLREARELIPTARAFSLMTLVRGIGVPVLCSPELTGEWEHKLKLMEGGKFSREKFMQEIVGLTRDIVGKAKSYNSHTVEGDYVTLDVPCPKCGKKPIQEYYRTYKCTHCDFELRKVLAGRQYEIKEVEELLTKRQVGPLLGFRSKLGRPFNAAVRLSPEFKTEFVWDNGTAPDGEQQAPDFSGQEPLGKCPECGGRVFENIMSYCCEHSVGAARTCSFRSGKIICKREIPREQMIKLLSTGKTDLLDKFISKKGRPFSAYLKIDNKRVGFEFEPRKSKFPPKAKTVKAAATAEGMAAGDPAEPKRKTAKPPKTKAKAEDG
ncbi:MAG: DNA topoisomerase III, partial [Verrucomicrobiae bacterium]|nr:DNA topoisomerase III [Verrucomicrobiae bacterium]